MKKYGARLKALCVLGAVAGPCAANAQEVKFNEQLTHYLVQGRTAEALFEDLIRKAMISPFGAGIHFAEAEPYTRWELNSGESTCATYTYTVYVDVTYKVPYWEDKEKASKRLQAYWEKYMESIWVHEKGHGDIALEAGVAVAKAFKKAPKADDCKSQLMELELIARPIIKEFEARQTKYDRETDHGWSQGAFFDVGEARRFKIPDGPDEKD